ncbi:hypothetical protein BOTBODRAFT_32824 [Botryobasidium botryosum FD-172 SS1]|uniref:Methyltransferase type 11 domain-containing protein n=1 Tax=Botryobasidium botryosum (strain FD-172 SS1) TaxID=930990 RepID=A0A067MFU4_BOTB1|nr:hypothetical protein BOTBODRAFT_32824 [Botryobasidium botryosum FD-172 SS1]
MTASSISYPPQTSNPHNILESFKPPARLPARPSWGILFPIPLLIQFLSIIGSSIWLGVYVHRHGWRGSTTWGLVSGLAIDLVLRPIPYLYALHRARFKFWDRIVRESAERGDRAVLDVACATGSVMLRMARANPNPGATVVGVGTFSFVGNLPNSPERLYLNALAMGVPLDRLAVHRIPSYTSLPFADESFDLVTTQCGISQAGLTTKRLKMALGECGRVLRPGGRLVIFQENPISLSVYRKLLSQEMGWTEVEWRTLWNCWLDIFPSGHIEAIKPLEKPVEVV